MATTKTTTKAQAQIQTLSQFETEVSMFLTDETQLEKLAGFFKQSLGEAAYQGDMHKITVLANLLSTDKRYSFYVTVIKNTFSAYWDRKTLTITNPTGFKELYIKLRDEKGVFKAKTFLQWAQKSSSERKIKPLTLDSLQKSLDRLFNKAKEAGLESQFVDMLHTYKAQ